MYEVWNFPENKLRGFAPGFCPFRGIVFETIFSLIILGHLMKQMM